VAAQVSKPGIEVTISVSSGLDINASRIFESADNERVIKVFASDWSKKDTSHDSGTVTSIAVMKDSKLIPAKKADFTTPLLIALSTESPMIKNISNVDAITTIIAKILISNEATLLIPILPSPLHS
jgi:hypothetical protein